MVNCEYFRLSVRAGYMIDQWRKLINLWNGFNFAKQRNPRTTDNFPNDGKWNLAGSIRGGLFV